MTTICCRVAPVLFFSAFNLWPLASAERPLDQLKPAPVPPQVKPPASAVKIQDNAGTAHAKPSASPNNAKVLVDKFKGITFFASPAAAATEKVGPGIHFRKIPMLHTSRFQAGMKLYLKHPLTRGVTRQITTLTQIYLNQRGYPFSVVYLPPQDITDGVLRVVVLVSHLESTVKVEGAKYFSPELYQADIPIKPGQAVNAKALHEDVSWINRNPFRAATIEAQPGTKPGTTQLVLKVREARPIRVHAGYDNYGTQLTQQGRIHAGINFGNAFGLGHQASFETSVSPDRRAFRSDSGSYSIDLPWRHILSFSGVYSVTHGRVARPFSLDGQSWQVAADYIVPLHSPNRKYSDQLDFGADLKSSNNNFSFSSFPLSKTLTQVIQARVKYSGSLRSALGDSSFDASLVASPGGLSRRNSDRFYELSRRGAKARYLYFNADAANTLPLDSIAPGMAWRVRGEFQQASTNLLGSEQIQGGGVHSVRGYQEGEVYTDDGVVLSQELHLPPVHLPASRGLGPTKLDAFLFEDYAHLWNAHPMPGKSTVDLHSVGVGVNCAVGRGATLQVSYGRQLRASGSSPVDAHYKLNLALNVSF